MKTTLLRTTALAAALGAFALGLAAQDSTYRNLDAPAPEKTTAPKAQKTSKATGSTARIAFSDTSKPGTLKINLAVAEIDIQGTSDNEIIVTSSLDKKGSEKVDSDGFRRLDESAAFELVESDNVATLKVTGANGWGFSPGAEFSIKVPRNTNLVIKTQSGEDIEIDDIDGDIEVSTTSGEISLENIAGSVMANTMSGSIDAEFKRAPKKPVSLTAMNGGITLGVPPATAANLRMRTMNGSLRTNFPETALKTTVTQNTASAKKIEMHIATDIRNGVTVVTTSTDTNVEVNASGYSYSTATPPVPPEPPAAPAAPTDDELVATIFENRKAQVMGYADKGIEAAQKGIEVALKAIESSDALSAEEKELIKRKIQAKTVSIPRYTRGMMAGPMLGGKTITGELNGGGVDIQLTTMSGNITLKQEK